MSSKILGVVAAMLATTAIHAQEISVVQTPSMNGKYAAPEMATCSMRPYPENSAKYGEEGTVVLGMLMDVSGAISSTKVMKSSGWRDLDKAAVAMTSARFCTFVVHPDKQNNQSSNWITLVYRWEMDKSDRVESAPELLTETCSKRDGVSVGSNQDLARTVKLRFHLTEDGKLVDIEKQVGRSDADIDERAIKFIQSCRYRPRTVNGKPVPGNAILLVQVEYPSIINSDENR